MEALTKTEQKTIKSALKREIERLTRAVESCQEGGGLDDHVKKLEKKIKMYNTIIGKMEV